jgi:hypothetical protein
VEKMNQFLYRSSGDGDRGGRRLLFVNAGHNPPYLVRRTEAGTEITELGAGRAKRC